MNKQEVKKEIKRQYKLLSNKILEKREKKEDANNDKFRDKYERDYARILYSSSFRRLQGKMQILGVSPTAFYRNRLRSVLLIHKFECKPFR